MIRLLRRLRCESLASLLLGCAWLAVWGLAAVLWMAVAS